jgi:hypothetical protein
MFILNHENRAYNLDKVPDIIDDSSVAEDIRYCIFDTNDPEYMDYYFMPLIFFESWQAPAAVMQIGEHHISLPMDWSILVCDEDFSALTAIPIVDLDVRGFHTIVYNPLKHMVPYPHELNIVNVFADVKWYMPKLRQGTILAVPVEDGESPRCILIVKDANKIPDDIDVAELFS